MATLVLQMFTATSGRFIGADPVPMESTAGDGGCQCPMMMMEMMHGMPAGLGIAMTVLGIGFALSLIAALVALTLFLVRHSRHA